MENRTLPAVATGTYRRSPWGAFVSLVVALLYGASPIDLLPDLIPLVGLVDDAVLIPVLLLVAFNLYRRRKRTLPPSPAMIKGEA